MLKDVVIGSALSEDQIIVVWLETKMRISGSQHTYKAYSDCIRKFQSMLASVGKLLNPSSTPPAELAMCAQGFCQLSEHYYQVSNSTYNQRLAILSSFYTFAYKRGFFTAPNPLACLERASTQTYAHTEPLEPEDVRIRLMAINRATKAGARDYAILSILLMTGRRVAEVAGLRWQDVKIVGEKITLTFHCKGGKILRDQLPACVGAALLEWLALAYGSLAQLPPGAPVFTSAANYAPIRRDGFPPPLKACSISDICKKRLGITAVHTTRHTFSRASEDIGMQVSEIQARLGHASLETTTRYLASMNQAQNDYSVYIASAFGLA